MNAKHVNADPIIANPRSIDSNAEPLEVSIAFPVFDRRGGIERVASECARYLAANGLRTHIIARFVDREAVGPNALIHLIQLVKTPYSDILRFPSVADAVIRYEVKARVRCGFGVQAPRDAVIWVPSVHKEWLRISRRLRGWRGRLRQAVNPFHFVALRAERRAFTPGRYRRLIALTPRVKEELIEHYAVPASDISILPNGFNSLEFNPADRPAQRRRLRDAHGVADDELIILFVANELHRKGFEPLLRAVARLGDAGVRLWVVGRAPIDRHASLIQRLGLTDRVKYLGSTSRVADFFHAADIFALPTQYEAWGLVIVEALACGVPVVTSRLAGAASAVIEGQTGELIDDPNDDAEIAKKLRAVLDYGVVDPHATSRSVAHLSWSEILPKYERIVFDAFGVPAPSSPNGTGA